MVHQYASHGLFLALDGHQLPKVDLFWPKPLQGLAGQTEDARPRVHLDLVLEIILPDLLVLEVDH